MEDEPRILAGRPMVSRREDRRAGRSAKIVAGNDGADIAMVQHGLTHPVGGAGVAAGAVEHQPDRCAPMSLQKCHDLPPGPVRQPAGDEQVGAPGSHRRVAHAAERVGEPVGQRDESQDASTIAMPDNAAGAAKNRLSYPLNLVFPHCSGPWIGSYPTGRH